MCLSAIDHMPLISEHSSSSLAFAVDGANVLTLVYEAKRDFLSTPRQFIELEARLDSASSLSTGGRMLDDDQWDTLESLEYGGYQISGGEGSSKISVDNALPHWVFYSPIVIVEFFAESVNRVKTHYHFCSLRDVLSAALVAKTKKN